MVAEVVAVRGFCWMRRAGSRASGIAAVLVLLASGALAQRDPAPPSAASAPAVQAPRLRSAPTTAPLSLSADVLSADERRFIAALPEVRVGLQAVGAPPYERVGADGVVSGLQPEMLSALGAAFGLRLRPVVFGDWPAVLAAARDRQVDMVMTLTASRTRQDYLAFTLGTAAITVAVIQRRDAPRRALEGARIALERDYDSRDIVARLYPRATVVPADGTLQALRLVAGGEADAYVGSLYEALELLTASPVPGLEVNRILENQGRLYHFGVRKDWPQLVTILNKGIAGWRAAGSMPSAAVSPASPVGLSPGAVAAPPPMALGEAEAAVLVRHSQWRIGAVRGLALLNDVDDAGNHSGIAADYTEQVARRLGIAVQLVPFDSVAEMLDALRAGRIDVVPFLTRTPLREREFAYSKAYFSMPYVLVARRDGTLYWDLASLHGKRLALALQHPLRERLAAEHPQITVVDTVSGSAAMDAVAEGRADAAVEIKLFANLRVNEDGGERLRLLGHIDELPAQFHFAAASARAELVPMIDRALDDVPPAERGRLLRRWVAVDLTAPWAWRRWLVPVAGALAALLLLTLGTAWWARRLAREVAARRRADEQLDDIGRTLPGVAFRDVLGADGHLQRTFFSSGAEAFFGFKPPPHETVLTLLAPYMSAADHAAALQAAQEAQRTGGPFRFTAPVRHPGGSVRWLQYEAVPSRTRDGQQAWTGYLIDVSAEHALHERLAQQARERHVMLASASHELRAPAHTLALALQHEALQSLPGTAALPLSAARDAAETIRQLLDDVLDAARLDAGQLPLHEQPVDVAALLREVAASQRLAIEARGLAFDVQIDPGLAAQARLDPLRVRQVLLNLLSNAAKYTRAGSVALRAAPVQAPPDDPAAAAHADGAAAAVPAADGTTAGASPGTDGERHGAPAEGWLALSVTDTGVGIAPQQQSRLFQPFVTLEQSTAGSPASSGLGLSICRRLVELMQGRIALESSVGAGTCVRVWLPLHGAAGRGDAPASALEAAPADGAPASPGDAMARPLRAGTVLLCDDDDVSRLLMAAALQKQALHIEQAGDGEEALGRWRRGDIGMVVADLAMPRLDGASLVRAIRASEAGAPRRTAIVVCSGSEPPADLLPMVDAFLSKPVDAPTLGRTLRQLLGAASRTPSPAD